MEKRCDETPWEIAVRNIVGYNVKMRKIENYCGGSNEPISCIW